MDTITVSENPLPQAGATLLRQALLVWGGSLLGNGFMTEDTAAAIATVLLIGGPLIYGQVKGWLRHRKLVTLAEAAPDSLATVK